jgi:cytochrome c biogenesis protein CcdA
MIRWHQTHSGVIISTLLGLSLLAFYLGLAGPWQISEWVFAILYFTPSVLLVAVIDHGHVNTPWSKRIWRLLASWLLATVWLIVGASILVYFLGGETIFTGTTAENWYMLRVMMGIAAIMAGIGIVVVRRIERQPDPFNLPREKKLTRVIRRDNMIVGKQV